MSWDYANYEYQLSAVLLVTSMIGLGTTLTPREFLAVLRAPRPVLLVLAVQVVVTPVLAIAIARLFSVSQGIALGMVLVAALPGGSFSNMFTYLGRGNVALSITATAVCTMTCLVTTSLVLKVFGATQLPDDFQMPAGRVLLEIVGCLLLPLAVGLALRRFAPALSRPVGKFCIRISIVVLLLIIVGSLTSGRIDIAQHGWNAVAALVLFGVASLVLCLALGGLVRLSPDDRLTTVIEVVIRNAHLGLLLKAALFPAVVGIGDPVGDGVLFAVLFYGGVSIVLGTIAFIEYRIEKHFFRMPKPAAVPEPQAEK